MISAELAVAVGLVLVPAIALYYRFRSHWAGGFAAEDEPDRGDFAKFVTATPDLKDNDKTAEPALFLVDRASKLYDEVGDATKNQEGKATTILGFVGGGASIFALDRLNCGDALARIRTSDRRARLFF